MLLDASRPFMTAFTFQARAADIRTIMQELLHCFAAYKRHYQDTDSVATLVTCIMMKHSWRRALKQ
jgi:hypothetical protein